MGIRPAGWDDAAGVAADASVRVAAAAASFFALAYALNRGAHIRVSLLLTKLGRWTGGLSGPAIKPLALARCHETARAISIPVIASGGLASLDDIHGLLEPRARKLEGLQIGLINYVADNPPLLRVLPLLNYGFGS